jgi:hypothetical protein
MGARGRNDAQNVCRALWLQARSSSRMGSGSVRSRPGHPCSAAYNWPYRRRTSRQLFPTRKLWATSVALQRSRLLQVRPPLRSQNLAAAGRQGARSCISMAPANVVDRPRKRQMTIMHFMRGRPPCLLTIHTLNTVLCRPWPPLGQTAQSQISSVVSDRACGAAGEPPTRRKGRCQLVKSPPRQKARPGRAGGTGSRPGPEACAPWMRAVCKRSLVADRWISRGIAGRISAARLGRNRARVGRVGSDQLPFSYRGGGRQLRRCQGLEGNARLRSASDASKAPQLASALGLDGGDLHVQLAASAGGPLLVIAHVSSAATAESGGIDPDQPETRWSV